MSSFIFESSLSYQDYLQAKSFEEAIRGEISESTQSLISTIEQANEEQSTQLAELEYVMKSGLQEVSASLHEVSAGIDKLNATFEWGLSQVLLSLGSIGDTLEDLRRIAKSPEQTWSYEQYGIVCEAYRRELFEESLQSVQRAINGHQGHTGFTIEHRFHFLEGLLRLGSFENTDSDVMDLVKAEESFLKSSRYARGEYNLDAARAFVAAGWAAYCQGRMDAAIEHTEKAIKLHEKSGEAHFQMAKTLMHINRTDEAAPYLRKAIDLDRCYALKAGKDGDFKSHEKEVNQIIDELRGKSQQVSEKSIEKAGLLFKDFRDRISALKSVASYSSNKEAQAESLIRKSTNKNNEQTLFGYQDSADISRQATALIIEANQEFSSKASEILNNEISQIDSKISRLRSTDGKRRDNLSIFGALGVFVGIASCTYYATSIEGAKLSNGVALFLGAIILFCLIGFIFDSRNNTKDLSSLKSQKSRLQQLKSKLQVMSN